MISKRKRRWKKKKILVIQMKAKKQENERKRKLSNGDNVDLKEEESVLGSNQARMVPRNRHLLGLDRMEAGGRVSRDELLKLLWNVWSLGKHDDGQVNLIRLFILSLLPCLFLHFDNFGYLFGVYMIH
ncbi:unnamed protein product [Brassica oleracea]|uniref:Uncharacterized protein n=1 Tax=Brassica oleracea var. oleracea TaxID=109376 RepID=A0A0D3C5R7_BRAOL